MKKKLSKSYQNCWRVARFFSNYQERFSSMKLEILTSKTKGTEMNQVIIGYKVKFTNWESSLNDYNFVTEQDATQFVNDYAKYGYTAVIKPIFAMQPVSVVA